MYTEKAIQSLNALIGGELKLGITESLVKNLRCGHAQYISQSTWDILARFLASGSKRPANRPATGKSDHIRRRNNDIKEEYLQLTEKSIDGHVSPMEAGKILAEKHVLSLGRIRNIVSEI